MDYFMMARLHFFATWSSLVDAIRKHGNCASLASISHQVIPFIANTSQVE